VSAGSANGKMSGPTNAVVDAVRRRLFVSENGNRRITVYSLASLSNGMNAVNIIGKSSFSDLSTVTSQNNLPGIPDMALVDSTGRVFVSDRNANRILVFDVTP
jgi:sugar lactone lactonase YvrE